MKLLSAQPDELYFLWQLQVQLYNFHKLGIEQDYVIALATKEPSPLATFIAKNTDATVMFIPDTRNDKVYSPSIQPHLYKQICEGFSGSTLLVDSDVVFTKVPKFYRLLRDNTVYLSDTKGYLGVDYLKSKGVQQFHDMCAIVDISPKLVESMDDTCGGAQVLLKHMMTPTFWDKVEQDSVRLYRFLSSRESEWKGEGYPIQKWTAGMWSLLWNIWRAGMTTQVAPELDFAWASDDVTKTRGKSILHMAGIPTASVDESTFFKGSYHKAHPFNTTINCTGMTVSCAYADMINEAKTFWIQRGWSSEI